MYKNLTVEEKLTIKSYNEGAEDWVREHSDPYWQEEFEIFKRLLTHGKILEIGCGGGRDARTLISMGYDYIGTDVTEKFVKLARKIIPHGIFLNQSVYGLSFKSNTFDGFWASAVFLHIPKNKIDKALRELKRVVKPTGIGFISLKQGKGEPILEEEFSTNKKLKRFWAFYHKPEFDEILKRNNFEILHFRKWIKSKRTTWLIYFVKVIK